MGGGGVRVRAPTPPTPPPTAREKRTRATHINERATVQAAQVTRQETPHLHPPMYLKHSIFFRRRSGGLWAWARARRKPARMQARTPPNNQRPSMDERKDGQPRDGWMGGWMDGWMDVRADPNCLHGAMLAPPNVGADRLARSVPRLCSRSAADTVPACGECAYNGVVVELSESVRLCRDTGLSTARQPSKPTHERTNERTNHPTTKINGNISKATLCFWPHGMNGLLSCGASK